MRGWLSVGTIAVLLLAGCAAPRGRATFTPPTTSSATVEPTLTALAGTPSELDQAFIDMMVPHHQAAVEMAKLAQDRAEHAELSTLADAIVSAQEREIGQMKAWRLAWFGSDATPPMNAMPVMPGVEMPGMGHGMDGQTMDMTTDIEELRTADPFDQAFIEAMILHHESAISAAQVILPQTDLAEIRRLAEDITESQQAEIDQMDGWLAEWYPEPS